MFQYTITNVHSMQYISHTRQHDIVVLVLNLNFPNLSQYDMISVDVSVRRTSLECIFFFPYESSICLFYLKKEHLREVSIASLFPLKRALKTQKKKREEKRRGLVQGWISRHLFMREHRSTTRHVELPPLYTTLSLFCRNGRLYH